MRFENMDVTASFLFIDRICSTSFLALLSTKETTYKKTFCITNRKISFNDQVNDCYDANSDDDDDDDNTISYRQ